MGSDGRSEDYVGYDDFPEIGYPSLRQFAMLFANVDGDAPLHSQRKQVTSVRKRIMNGKPIVRASGHEIGIGSPLSRRFGRAPYPSSRRTGTDPRKSFRRCVEPGSVFLMT